MRRSLPIIATLAVLFGLVKLFRVAQRYDPSLERAGVQSADVSVRLTDAVIVSREEGKPRWSLRAATIDLHPEAFGGLESIRSVEFRGIRNGTIFRKGRPEATFSADSATFEQSTQRFDLEGSLRLSTPKGDRVESEQCIWSEAEDFIRLPRGGRGTFNGYKLSAPVMLYEPKKRLIQCPRGGEAARKNESIRAASMLWDVEDGRVHCEGPVSGERGSLVYSVQSVDLDLKRHTMVANNGSAKIRIGREDEPPEDLR